MKAKFLEVVIFGMTSLAGVFVDLLVFYILFQIQAGIFAAATISGTAAILTNSFLSMRFAFRVEVSTHRYLQLSIYYLMSIMLFALAISWFSQWAELSPILVKALSSPISFTVNYLSSKKILRR